MRYEFISSHKKAYPVILLCATLKVTRSGYYRYEKIPKLDKDEKLIIEIKVLHNKTNRSYGSRRISKVLQENNYKIGRYKARSLMRKAGIECKQRRRYKITTQSDTKLPIAENILNRNFAVQKPNKVWMGDITAIWTFEGWLYLAAILDAYSRRIIGWAVADHTKRDLVCDALKMALGRRHPIEKLLHHSDRGSQYASFDYQALLQSSGITASMSRKGNCWDNAVMERFFGSLKSERTDNKKYITKEQAKADIIDYIEMFYNSQRLHSSLGYLSPLDYENKLDS
jgi:putative transposase